MKNAHPIIHTILKLLIIGVMVLASVKCYSQMCAQVQTLTTLPHTSDWCIDQEGEAYFENAFSQTHPQFGCWNCLVSPRWFVINAATDDILSMDIQSSLTSPTGVSGWGVPTYYAVFTDCPEDGGTVLSYPCNCFGDEECWDDFGGNSSFIEASCFYGAIASQPLDWHCQLEEPWWNYPVGNYYMEFNLQAGNTYWIGVFPSASCVTDQNSYGCISVTFGGTVLLDLIPSEDVEPSNYIALPRVRKIFTPDGVLIEYRNGPHLIVKDLTGRVVKNEAR